MAIYKLVRRFEDGREEPLPFDVIGGWFLKPGSGMTIDDEAWTVAEVFEHPPTVVATKLKQQ
jgi:hypothetical protein